MASRMERYYKTDSNDSKRSERNAVLYREIYDEAQYSNIEGIATIEKTNEIDIRQIKELLKNRDIKNVKEPYISKTPIVTKNMEVDEIKNYDIKEILTKAKVENTDENKYRSLGNTQYDILKNLSLKENFDRKDYEPEEELKELIHTITSTSVLKKMNDDELSLGILSDLMPDDENSETTKGISKILKSNDLEEKHDEMDKSFFTTSLNFKDNDFEELKDMNTNIKKNNVLMKLLITILVLVIIAGIVFLIYYILNN